MTESQKTDAMPGLEALSFEEAFRQLGELVQALEQGGLPLDQATERYQQGMELVQRCNQLLNEAQLKVTQLKEDHTVADGGSDWEELFEE